MLEIVQLDKAYGPTSALTQVCFSVPDGEIVGFVGSNGAGKSTAMRIAMGLVSADGGSVLWNDEPVTFAARRRFGYMPEGRGLYPKMRIVEQLAYFGQLHGLSAAKAGRAAAKLIDRMAVRAEPNAQLQSLSLGNQQRVQLAAALVHDPSLLILDEPFAGLDLVGVDTMAQVLRERQQAGVGTLFSSHQLELVERLCDRVVIINAGRVIAVGTLEQLRKSADRELEVAVDAPLNQWLTGLNGVQLLSEVNGRVRLRLTDPACDQLVLVAAVRAGRVTAFGWRQPSLAELYRDVVTAT